MKPRKLFLALSFIFIVAIVLVCFARTLNSYFLEDDLGEVLYAHQIFSGNWQQLISNFTGNYMSVPTMKVYRPCLLLSIMADYTFWKTNASGYFATNIIFLIAGALTLYMVLLELTRSWNRTRSVLFAFFSAALFASHPLHCESVSLMVGRVDIICAFFYLLSLWSFIHKGNTKNWLLTLLGLISFSIALLTKEMAIGLPIISTAICILLPDVVNKKSKDTSFYTNEQIKPTVRQRLILAINISYPLWINSLFYFIIRYFTLGTFVGGYTGSVGANQFSRILEKWTDLDTIYRIIFPLNQAVFTGHSLYWQALCVIYCALIILIFAKIVFSGIPRIWLLLLTLWTITVLAPIYQLWGLGFNLEGGRFLFFLTIPLAVLLPLLIFAPINKNDNLAGKNNPLNNFTITDLKILVPSILCLSLLIILNTIITTKNNIPWIHAGKQIKSLLEEGQNLAQSLSKEQKVIVLGIPKEIDGAHVIYNGLSFNFLMSQPFSRCNYADKFITFDPVLFGNANLINTSRFRQTIKNPNTIGCYVWQAKKMIFEQLALPANNQSQEKNSFLSLSLPFPSPKNILLPFTWQRGSWQSYQDRIDINNCSNGAGIAIGPVSIDPFTCDFIEIEAAIVPPINAKQISIFWQDNYLNPEQSKNIATANDTGIENTSSEYKIYRIALSRYWRWFTNKQVQGLWLEFPSAQSISIKNIRLLSDLTIVPKLNTINLEADNTGVYHPNKSGFTLQVDASQLTNCTSVKLEISKSNYFFDNFDSSNSEQAVMSKIIVNGKSKDLFIDSNSFPISGYYQIRIIGLNNEGNPIGEWSDPITIKI